MFCFLVTGFACFVDQGNLDLSEASIEGSCSPIGLEAAKGRFY